MMRAGSAHKAPKVLTAILIASFTFISSCDEKEKIVYVPMEDSACPPSAPRGVYAVNLDGAVQICWYPNPEDDIVGYDIWKNEDLYGTYEWIGTVDAESPDPYEYCFEYDDLTNGEKLFYAVSAYNQDDILSDLSYEDVSATPRPEGLLRLYDAAADPDSCGYDFTNFESEAQDCTLPSTDIWFDTTGAVNLFRVASPSVKIQDYGFTSYEWPEGLDVINTAPVDGWSVTGTAEVLDGHCYMLRLGEADGFHYVKLWVLAVADGHTDFWWAYQTDPGNTDLMQAGDGEEETYGKQISGHDKAGGIKIMNGFPKGRQVPPTQSSGKQDDDSILQRQNTLP